MELRNEKGLGFNNIFGYVIDPSVYTFLFTELSPSWEAAQYFQHFMEPEGSLSCSQELSIGPYPEPDRSNPYRPIPSL
jgi:hypothetical protein